MNFYFFHSFLFDIMLLFVILQENKLRKGIHNKLLEIQGNIRVICRVRPVLDMEKKLGEDIDITEISSEVRVRAVVLCIAVII